jgi:hypothetical protein
MRIFVSSTFKDLRPERESAQEALRRSELVPWGMELFVSEPSKPLDVCLEQVQLSDAVILIIGFMAGLCSRLLKRWRSPLTASIRSSKFGDF